MRGRAFHCKRGPGLSRIVVGGALKLSIARFALVIGSVSALGPIAIDMYLPGLPSIARDLHAGPGQVELTLTSFFIGNTLGQLFYGPVSDRVGRRLPLLFGLVLFVLGGLACSASPSLVVLITARLFQGLGGAAAQVIGSAVIRDLYTGHEAARLQATRMLVIAVSPVLAPIIGAAIIAAAPWRWIFYISAGLGAAGLLLILFLLPETRTPEARQHTRIGGSFAVYRRLLVDGEFIRLVLIAGLTQGALFAYLSGSSFVIMTLNNAPAALYSLIFAVNAAGFIGLAQFSPQLMRRYGPEKLIMTGTGMLAAGSSLLLATTLAGHAVLPIMAPMLLFGITGVGLVFGPLGDPGPARPRGGGRLGLGPYRLHAGLPGRGGLVPGVDPRQRHGPTDDRGDGGVRHRGLLHRDPGVPQQRARASALRRRRIGAADPVRVLDQKPTARVRVQVSRPHRDLAVAAGDVEHIGGLGQADSRPRIARIRAWPSSSPVRRRPVPGRGRRGAGSRA